MHGCVCCSLFLLAWFPLFPWNGVYHLWNKRMELLVLCVCLLSSLVYLVDVAKKIISLLYQCFFGSLVSQFGWHVSNSSKNLCCSNWFYQRQRMRSGLLQFWLQLEKIRGVWRCAFGRRDICLLLIAYCNLKTWRVLTVSPVRSHEYHELELSGGGALPNSSRVGPASTDI